MEVKFGQRIAVKQAKSILLISLLLGFLFTSLQLYLDVKEQKQQANDELNQALSLHSNSAKSAVYNIDRTQGMAITDSLVLHPAVTKAYLFDDFGDALAVSNSQPIQPENSTHDHANWLVFLHVTPSKELFLKVASYPNDSKATQTLARLVIELDQDYLINSATSRASRAFLFGLLFTIALSFIFFWLNYRCLSKPIIEISEWVDSLANHKATPRLPYIEKDELGNLVDRFHTLWDERTLITNQLNSSIEELSKSEFFARTLMNNAGDAMYLCHLDTTINQLNHQAEQMLGGSQTQLIGTSLSQYSRLFSQQKLQTLFANIEHDSATEFEDEFWLSTSDSLIPVESRGIRINLESTSYILIISRDISQRRASEKEIHELAFYDSLTKLPNRRLFLDRLTSSMLLHESNGQYGAVCYLDLDQFKTVNDSLGHTLGDSLLNVVARRLSEIIPKQGSCARFGGDEFVLLLPELSDKKEHCAEIAAHTAENVLKAIAQPIDINGQTLYTTSSLGIAVFPSGYLDSTEILQHADTALYRAKSMGRNRFNFYSQDMQHAAKQRLLIEKGLHEASDNHEFQLWLQPQYDGEGNIFCAEGLIRWIHPESGLIPPDEFIHIAEESGQIIEIGQWVIAEALDLLNLWMHQGLPKSFKRIAINISPLQFMQVDFVSNLLNELNKKEIPPTMLELEITENLLLSNPALAAQKMKLLKQHGITFAIDDFGTGYSSFKYLQKLPLDILKIDRSFVTNIHLDTEDAAVAEAIITTARLLNLSTIAEGVELAEEKEVLERLGCHHFQGYLFSRPLPAVEFFELLTDAQTAES